MAIGSKSLLLVAHSLDYGHPRNRFICSWVEEFSKVYDLVHVVVQYMGDTRALPSNVVVHSLGKDKNKRKCMQFFNFVRLLVRLRRSYNRVLVHNYANWVTIGFPFFWVFGKPVYFWHCNRERKFRNYIAGQLADRIFTHSENSFPYPMPHKTSYFGHGIDVSSFSKGRVDFRGKQRRIRILAVGRPSKEKRFSVLISALQKVNFNFEIHFVLSVSNERDYKDTKTLISSVNDAGIADKVLFSFNVPNENMVGVFKNADVAVNLSTTGALDKVVLEAIAARTPPLVCNYSFKETFGDHWDLLSFKENDVEDLVNQIVRIKGLANRDDILKVLIKRVSEKHSVQRLISDFRKEFDRHEGAV